MFKFTPFPTSKHEALNQCCFKVGLASMTHNLKTIQCLDFAGHLVIWLFFCILGGDDRGCLHGGIGSTTA